MTGSAPQGSPAMKAGPAGTRSGYRLETGQGSRPEASILTMFEGARSGFHETATAIRDQSFQAFEWIVVADGNRRADDARMLEDLSREDPRIRVIRAADSDAAAARRLGVDAARSTYLCEIASGDTYERTALERALWALESRGVVDRGARWRIERTAAAVAESVQRADPGMAYETIPLGQPFRNRLEKPAGTRRVLLMLPWLNVGGVEKFNLDLVGQLHERRHEVSVSTYLAGDDPWLPRFLRLTPDIFSLPTFLRPADFPRFLLYLIESRGIDVVLVSNGNLGYQLLPFLRSRCPGIAFIDYVHIEAEHWQNGGFGRTSVAYQELLDLTIVSTAHLRRWMVQRGGVADRIEVCHTNVDTTLWDPARWPVDEVRRGLAVPDGVPLVLHASRIVPQKRPRLLAEVIRRLALKEGLAFVCVVAGEGESLPELREFVTEHGLESWVRFVGAVTPERMQELQAAADIFFLPSRYEGLSLALYEALAMETVPVASDVGGQRELVTPDCGILIPRGDDEIDRYVAALQRLLERPELRRMMAAAGRARVVKHFPLGGMGNRMVELLEQATGLARSSPRPAVESGLGLECATLAIEYARLEGACDAVGRRAAEATATAEMLRRHIEELEAELADFRGVAGVTRLSGEQIARLIGARRIVQALAFRLASKPGLTWLRAFRTVGKRILGG